MFNIQQLMKQAQVMQKKVEEMQNELKATILDGQAGGGAVEVKVNAKNEFVSIKIKPEAINPDNPEAVDKDSLETLEDLITSAIKDANSKATAIAEEKTKAITGGIKIPGMF